MLLILGSFDVAYACFASPSNATHRGSVYGSRCLFVRGKLPCVTFISVSRAGWLGRKTVRKTLRSSQQISEQKLRIPVLLLRCIFGMRVLPSGNLTESLGGEKELLGKKLFPRSSRPLQGAQKYYTQGDRLIPG